ncbi:MAG: hypothetical protein J6W80_03500, partial [Kiritimatiellae bacterium]|nr:hypothetical protein [Kiritimatiellia bacterium]
QDAMLTELSRTSSTVNSRKAAFVYEGSRLKVLRDHNWNFARKEMETGGARTATLPAKCVRLLACIQPNGEDCHYRLFGREVRSNEPLAKIVYTGDVEDLDKWTSDAYRTLVLRLAADLAKPITGRINERQLQEQAYQDQLAQAKLADARESNVAKDPWGSNYYADAMKGGANPRAADIFRR